MRKIIIFAGLAVLLVGLPLVAKLTKGGGDAKEVEITQAEHKLIRSSILASGTLAFREQVQLRSEVIGKVAALHVQESDLVNKGDLVIELDTETYDAQVEQAEARVRIAEIAIERQKLLVANLERRYRNQAELISKSLVDQDSFDNLVNELGMAKVDAQSLQESLSQARAALAQSRDLLAKTQIRSPIDGIVIQVDVKVGETVIAGTTNIPGSTLVVIADPSEMLTEVQVDEADIATVREGQSADIFAAAYPDTPLHGTVESIATVARATPGQQSLWFLVKILLDEQDELNVRSGMSVRADIYTETSEESLAVPVQAVQYEEDEEAEQQDAAEITYVFVVENGKAVRREVKTGVSSDSDQEILEGIKAGDRVVSGPYRVLRHLQDGDAVKEKEDSKNQDKDDQEDGND